MKVVKIDGDVQVLGRNSAVKLMLDKAQQEAMPGLFTEAGRRRAAEVVVYGATPRRLSREAIKQRLEKVLERMSKKLQARASLPRN